MKKMRAAVLPKTGDLFLGMISGQDYAVKHICYVHERDGAPLGIQVELISTPTQ